MASTDYSNLPTYAELAERTKDHPVPGHAWDVWNKPGSQVKDSLGCMSQTGQKSATISLLLCVAYLSNLALPALNLLTPANILQAKDEIRTGIRVQIDLPLDALKYTLHQRVQLKQEIVDYSSHGLYAHDDVLTYNTQTSSQWVRFCLHVKL